MAQTLSMTPRAADVEAFEEARDRAAAFLKKNKTSRGKKGPTTWGEFFIWSVDRLVPADDGQPPVAHNPKAAAAQEVSRAAKRSPFAR